MKTESVADLSPVDRFLYWIKERHQIYQRKQSGMSPPWTDDEILQIYFFTNPYRENDKTTVWFRENVRDPLRDQPEVLMATVIFRWFNFIPTGEVLLNHDLLVNWNRAKACKILSGRPKVFTGAYVVNARHGPKNAPPRTKVDVVCERINNVWKDRKSLITDFEKYRKMEDSHNRLRRYMGLNGTGFSAYEIVSDLRYTYLLERAVDKMTWCNPGHGCIRGLNVILGRPMYDGLPSDWREVMRTLLRMIRDAMPEIPRFEMREVEHSLCEFHKYYKILEGKRPKRRYPQS